MLKTRTCPRSLGRPGVDVGRRRTRRSRHAAQRQAKVILKDCSAHGRLTAKYSLAGLRTGRGDQAGPPRRLQGGDRQRRRRPRGQEGHEHAARHPARLRRHPRRPEPPLHRQGPAQRPAQPPGDVADYTNCGDLIQSQIVTLARSAAAPRPGREGNRGPRRRGTWARGAYEGMNAKVSGSGPMRPAAP